MPHFSDTFLEELRQRVSLQDVVGRYVKLQSKSGGEFLGLCPFHNENTPSFTLNEQKGFYHCFGCGAHGDVIRFVMEHNGWPFVEAVTRLAEEAGMTLPKENLSPKETEQKKQKNTLHTLMEEACTFFEEQLQSHASAHLVKDYLERRGVDQSTQHTFRLGYAPDSRNSLLKAMEQKGYAQALLAEAGLIIVPEKGNPYDRFRQRLIFPITDKKNRVVAFGGRILGEGQPKYLNSPETPLFHKGTMLYGLPQAQNSAFKKQAIALVEGYMDVIALHQAGIHNSVAPLGTALTQTQLQTLWRMAKEPVLCLDGDAAGQRAMQKAAHMSLPLLKPGHSLRFALLPPGKDPDDVIQAQGVSALRQILGKALPLADVLWNSSAAVHTGTTPETKAAFEQALMALARTIEDKTLQQHYLQYFKNKLWQQNKTKRSTTHPNTTTQELKSLQAIAPSYSARFIYEASLLLLVFFNPNLLAKTHQAEAGEAVTPIEELISDMHMETEPLAMLQTEILEPSSNATEAPQDKVASLSNNTLRQFVEQLLHYKGIDKSICRPLEEEKAMAAWSYILSNYQVTLLQEEYTNLVQTSKLEQAEAITHAITKQKRLAENQKITYEAAFGG